MGRNKLRLYLAIYEQTENPKQHRLALITCPKHHDLSDHTKHIKKYQITKTASAGQEPSWEHEQTTMSSFNRDPNILALFRLGKLKLPTEQIDRILAEVPINSRHGTSRLHAGDVNQESWVGAAITALAANTALAPPMPTWHQARKEAYSFVSEELTAGRWSPGWKEETGIPLRYYGSGLTVYIE